MGSTPTSLHSFSSASTAGDNQKVQFQVSLIEQTRQASSSGTEASTIPLFTPAVYGSSIDTAEDTKTSAAYPQYSLLAGLTEVYSDQPALSTTPTADPASRRIFQNTNVPFSTFICGSQGSGKSHTLSCMLENYLLRDERLGTLDTQTSRTTGMILHYDSFSMGTSGQPCEAAYLCSAGIDVTILVSPSNLTAMKNLYEKLPGLPTGSKKPKVAPFQLSDGQLNIKHMLSLMGADLGESTPLYMLVFRRILRELATENKFTYAELKRRLQLEDFLPSQRNMLDMRLDLIESFLLPDARGLPRAPRAGKSKTKSTSKKAPKSANPPSKIWTFGPGSLTIVDLSCPFVDATSACLLFSIAIEIFLSGNHASRVLALDEAHKFINGSVASEELSNKLIQIIRLQRHLGTRMIISTQEPTISNDLLDLMTVTIVHRFSSPAWLNVLKDHLAAGASTFALRIVTIEEQSDEKESPVFDKDARVVRSDWKSAIFEVITSLGVGEALIFAPTAAAAVGSTTSTDLSSDMAGLTLSAPISRSELRVPILMKGGIMKVQVRSRISVDGGRSRMAV